MRLPIGRAYSMKGEKRTILEDAYVHKLKQQNSSRNKELLQVTLFHYSIIMLDQVESLTNLRVSAVELRFPAPPHFGHSFLESPSPVVPLP